MIKHISRVPGATALESLKMLLDYAIAEGSELNLPVFVGLLRMASLELERSTRHPRVPVPRPRHQTEERVAS